MPFWHSVRAGFVDIMMSPISEKGFILFIDIEKTNKTYPYGKSIFGGAIHVML